MEEHVYEHMYRVETAHWWFTARREILLHAIATLAHPAPAARVLDVGCGTGAILEELTRRYDAAGLDPSAQAVAFCRKRGLVNVAAGLLDDFRPPQPYDLITMFDVVEHVEDDLGLLRAARARLVPGGRILIAVPAYRWLWARHDDVLHHRRRYTRGSLLAVVRTAGFSVEHATYFNTLLFPVALLRRVIGRLAGMDAMNDLEIPSPALNRLLRGLFLLERPLVPHVRFPFGLSILCLGKVP